MPAPGSRLTNPVLADTYERLAGRSRAGADRATAGIEAARADFYRGFVAEAIDAFVRIPAMDTSGTAARRPADRGRPRRLAHAARGAGDVRLRRLPGRQDAGVGTGTGAAAAARPARRLRPRRHRTGRPAALVHTVVECAKLAFADREAFYGDVADVPLATLLSPAYNDDRRRLVGRDAELRHCARARRTAGRRVLPAPATGVAAAGVGEPTTRRRTGRRLARRDSRRHLPRRRRRPVRQHGLGHAERRLAAELAGHPVARLRARHPGADVLAAARACPTRSRPASARAPRCRRRSRCATACPTSPSARPAATSRISGSCSSSCSTPCSA